jgi:hypothetical protein
MTYCSHCGSGNPEGSSFCNQCGAPFGAAATRGGPLPGPPVYPPPYASPYSYPQYDYRRNSGFAVASLVIGILSIWPLVLIGSVLALIFGIIATTEVRRAPQEYKGSGMATAGIILGSVSGVFWLLIVISMAVYEGV